jgi:excinuclease ABC subunit B
MEYAIKETKRRREIQERYNLEHNITPKTIVKDIYDAIKVTHNVKEEKVKQERVSITEINELLADLEHQMYEAAKKLDFEHATILRDSIIELKAEYKIK